MLKKIITLMLIIFSSFMLLQPVLAQRGIDPNLKPEYAPDFPFSAADNKAACEKLAKSTGNKYVWNEKSKMCIEPGYEAEPINAYLQTLAGALLMMSGAIAVIVFAVAGVMYITARGNQQQMEYAKKHTLVYGVVGLIVIVFSYFIVRFVLENITQI